MRRRELIDIGVSTTGVLNGNSERWRRNASEDAEEERWRMWEGRSFKKIYTDGSYKKIHTLRSLLMGGGTIKEGGAIVIAEEGGYYSPIRIDMDFEVESAFPVETISILGACEMVSHGQAETTQYGLQRGDGCDQKEEQRL
jgi:hypothetical protein